MNICAYATFREIKQYFANNDGYQLTIDDNLLKGFALQASRKVDEYCNRKFFPIVKTRLFDYPNSSILSLKDDLLQVFDLTTDSGLTTLTSSDYYLVTGKRYDLQPYSEIALSNSVSFGWSDTVRQSTSVKGVWGFHSDYPGDAWVALDTLQADITDSQTTISVSSVSGLDELGMTPRFKIQNLIKIGEDTATDSAEFCYVTNVSPENNTLTINRAVNGTAAAPALTGTSVYVYRPIPDIVEAVKYLATYSYRRKDALGTVEERTIASTQGVLLLPAKLPSEITDILDSYRRWEVQTNRYSW